ncbi:hypothetical protein [Reichenbachiella sp. MSK19-1]|uniref:hypothetical protein n=1 Tax=Reichenbachiella sp. MSK19-1 TaxID=1897631 RepID=UPI000E6BA0AB|nr:hypothetical protein [Reichenbachiella sp. MSK19-1]RJE71764.1 hypothetical protein BGP76_06660 [Reichenbachiella sp. MSK19-1]
MTTEIIKYLTVYLSSTIKVIFGCLLGTGYGHHFLITGVLTTLGMMTSVYIVTYFGTNIRHASQAVLRRKQRNIFSRKSRQYVRVWQKYGMPGIAFLTPLLLMPIGGAVIANAFGAKKKDIFKYMWISCTFWGFVLSALVKFAGHWIPFLDLP